MRWINFKNGYYDPVTGEMLEHNPDYLTINQIPFSYYPEDCEQVLQGGENIKKYLASSLSNKEEQQTLEYEFNGNYERIRAEAERTNGSDEEFAGYYRQVEAACEGTGGNTGKSDSGEGRVAGEKSEDERVYSGISGKNTQVENGKTEAILRESQAARRNAEIERRNSADDSRTVRNAEKNVG